jgi:hypothetical protein
MKKYNLEDLTPPLQRKILEAELGINERLKTNPPLFIPKEQMITFFPRDFRDMPHYSQKLYADALFVLSEELNKKEYKFSHLTFR